MVVSDIRAIICQCLLAFAVLCGGVSLHARQKPLDPPAGLPEEMLPAWTAAAEFLSGQNMACERLRLRYTGKNVAAFEDVRAKSFAWVDTKGLRILAYGSGNRMWDGKVKEESPVSLLFGQYNASFPTLTSASGAAGPLMQGIVYSQDKPYNDLFPALDGRRCAAGCGAVALAEILTYYRHPSEPEGRGVLKSAAGDTTVVFDGGPIGWPAPAMPELMLRCAASIRTKAGAKNSSSRMVDIQSALICNWHYRPSCKYYQRIPLERMLGMIRRELDAGRPVILGGGDHSFVCDGYRGNFLHLVFGWGGYCDGYYLEDSEIMPFDEILCRIEPMREAGDSLEVNVRKAGTLAAQIPEDIRGRLGHLKVSGKLDGRDIALIRSMAGAGDFPGMLTSLDMSGAKIVGGSEAYFSEDASGMTVYSAAFNPILGAIPGSAREWDVASMTEQEWKAFCARRLNYGDGYRITRDTGGTNIEYYTRKGVVGEKMFAGCAALRTVILPDSAIKIEDSAFLDCFSLQHVFQRGVEVPFSGQSR